MDRLKAALLDVEQQTTTEVLDRVEVVGQSIASCLNRGAAYLNVDLSRLDYEILEKGKKSFLSPRPYRILVSLLPEENRYVELEELSEKLGVGGRLLSEELDQFVTPRHMDGRVLVRIYRSGCFITVFPPLGNGASVTIDMALLRIQQMGLQNFDRAVVERAIQEKSGEPTKIGKYEPRPENDSTVKVEISPDEMKATIKVTPQKPGGRHLEVSDIVNALKSYGVVLGFKEEEIQKALAEDRYMEEIVAAEGIGARHGQDAYIDYKVQIKKDEIKFEEDSQGRVDFKKMNLVENVVVGQILAEKHPATRGEPGRTLMNRYVEARDGRDIELKQGKGTILSEEKDRLIAEINGQVVYSNGKLSVEPVFRVVGDVGPKTGNIMFLGSVQIGGSVLDNYEVKAAGNVEVGGSVQKARIEAEGDIIVKAGILGKDEAYVESTGGSLLAKFVQSAQVKVAQDVVVQEGILHSRVEAGNIVLCNGRRAQIVGGSIRATKEVRARMIGSQAYTPTEIVVGIDPRVLSQAEELQRMLTENEDRGRKLQKEIATLEARYKSDPDGFSEEQKSKLDADRSTQKKVNDKIAEIKQEVAQLEEYMQTLGAEGKVHAEKELFPGVVVTIRDATQNISDSYRAVTLRYDNKYVKIDKLEKAEKRR